MSNCESDSSPPKKKRALFTDPSTSSLPSTSQLPLETASVVDHGQVCETSHKSAKKDAPVKSGSAISGQSFKDIVYRCMYSDFSKPYNKLNSVLLPECCDPQCCSTKHKNVRPREITSFSNATFFSILDNPLPNWLYDISTAAFSILSPQFYFRGDVLRILFDYILNGPEEHLMWDVKHIIACHLEVHPPCTETMREFYLNLLSQTYRNESYFNTDLNKTGVFNYIIDELEKSHDLAKPPVEEELEESDGVKEKLPETESASGEITFEKMEERWNNFEPLLDVEYKEVVNALEELEKCTQETDESTVVTKKSILRLAIALELVVNILETDFLICVSKLKKFISSGISRVVPLVKQFMDQGLHCRVFQLYARTTNQVLWVQFSRLISVMAEFEHLFEPLPEQQWRYPHLHARCGTFATFLCNYINNCDWDEEERMLRLQLLQPPWLRLHVTMRWVNSDLQLEMGSDLKALVDIIHMHIICPVKFEKDVHFKVNDISVKNESLELRKKATKRNQYGETLLHRVCKQKKSSNSLLFNLLALPSVDVNAKDNYGWTPLHETVLSQSVFKTKTLLQYQPPPGRKPIDVGAQNTQGGTPLHEAVIADNLQICKLLVNYGGTCLLRKTDYQGVTPLQLASENEEISRFFERVIKTQEMLNLSPDSVLNLPENVVQLLVLACNAFLADHHTPEVYRSLRFNPSPKKLETKKWIVVDQNTLLSFKNDQDQFRKLRKILNKLAENPKNIHLVSLWNTTFEEFVV